MSSQKLNLRQARQILYLSRFDFILKHMPRSSMKRADSLSKCSDQHIGIERDNKDKVLVKKEWPEIRVIQVIKVVIEEIDLLEKIRKSEAKDNKVVKAVEEMKQAGVKILKDEQQQEKNELMLRDKKIYVLRDKKLRTKVIQLYYDTLIEEYKGQQRRQSW